MHTTASTTQDDPRDAFGTLLQQHRGIVFRHWHRLKSCVSSNAINCGTLPWGRNENPDKVLAF